MADEDIFAQAAKVAMQRDEQVVVVVCSSDVTPPTDWPGFQAGAKVFTRRQVEAGLKRYIEMEDK